MPYANEHAARILSPGQFDVIRRQNNKFGSGVHAIFGRKGDGPMKVQAIRFDAKKFTTAQAKKWLSDNDYKPIEFEAATGGKELDMPNEEVKEIAVEEKCGACEPKAPYVPFGVTSFAELQAAEAAQEATEDVHDLATQFQGIVNNIMGDPALEDKAGAVTAAATELIALVNQAMSETKERADTEPTKAPVVVEIEGKSMLKELLGAVGEFFGLKPKETPPPAPAPDPGLMLWKEADRYRWLAVFSNKYRDNDTPPEILASEAHKEFVGAVESGAWPYPELRHFHVKGTKWGTADWITYDEKTGFTLASGLVDAGHEKEAVALMALMDSGKSIKVSHGMPVAEIQRDKEDPTIITRYRTVEISDLPGWAAANPLTGFEIASKEGDMPIPENKVPYLKDAGVTDEEIEMVNAMLAGKAKEAENLESKEAPPAEAAPVEAPAAEVTPAAQPITRQEILEAIQAAIGPLASALAEVQGGVKELKEAGEAKAKETSAATPAYSSLVEMLRGSQRAVGADAARVEKGERVKGPKETKAPEDGKNFTGIPFINQILAGTTVQQDQ